jgi:hypothetical protein
MLLERHGGKRRQASVHRFLQQRSGAVAGDLDAPPGAQRQGGQVTQLRWRGHVFDALTGAGHTTDAIESPGAAAAASQMRGYDSLLSGLNVGVRVFYQGGIREMPQAHVHDLCKAFRAC